MRLPWLRCFLLGVILAAPLAGGPLREGATVALAGTIEKTWAYGRPGFGEDPAVDEIEHYFVVNLPDPISIRSFEGDVESEVSRVQIIVSGRDSPQWRELSSLKEGGRVRVVGEIMIASTGHHHERVLMNLVAVEAAERAGGSPGSGGSVSLRPRPGPCQTIVLRTETIVLHCPA